jgi:hypothetical protein
LERIYDFKRNFLYISPGLLPLSSLKERLSDPLTSLKVYLTLEGKERTLALKVLQRRNFLDPRIPWPEGQKF